MATSIKDIAAKAGVSVSAVSLALNAGTGRKRVSDKRAQQIRQIANEMNYRPNSAARTMVSNKTMQIGILLRNAPDRPMHNPENLETILGIGESLAKAGYVQVLVPLSKVDFEKNQDVRVFNERLLDGIIVMDVQSDMIYKYVKDNFRHSLFLETNYWNKQMCLRRDEEAAGFLAAEKLIESGYSKIMYLGPIDREFVHFSSTERYQGVLKAVEGKNIELITEDLTPENEYELVEMMQKIIDNTEKGVGTIAYNAPTAELYYYLGSQSGLIPPRDYGLICCDGSFDTRMSFPMLSRVGFDRYQLGVQAAQMLIESIEKPDKNQKSKLFEVSWIPGKTIK